MSISYLYKNDNQSVTTFSRQLQQQLPLPNRLNIQHWQLVNTSV